MTTAGIPEPNDLTPSQTKALLQRVLVAVEKDQRNRWVEIVCVVVLSLATISTAWCAYQATLWGGVQTFCLAAANKAGRNSTAASLAALQSRAFDATMFIHYVQAKNEGNELQEKFLFNRFRPEMKHALQAWLKTDPFTDPAAPPAPFKMAEYVQQELEEASRQDGIAAQQYDFAQNANEHSDAFVLLTVLFATVLFFGGIASTLDSKRQRFMTLFIALALLTPTLVLMATMPLCTK